MGTKLSPLYFSPGAYSEFPFSSVVFFFFEPLFVFVVTFLDIRRRPRAAAAPPNASSSFSLLTLRRPPMTPITLSIGASQKYHRHFLPFFPKGLLPVHQRLRGPQFSILLPPSLPIFLGRKKPDPLSFSLSFREQKGQSTVSAPAVVIASSSSSSFPERGWNVEWNVYHLPLPDLPW